MTLDAKALEAAKQRIWQHENSDIEDIADYAIRFYLEALPHAGKVSEELWALCYLHDWDPQQEGQEHRWEPGKNVFPQVHAFYTSWHDAEAIRKDMTNPEKYWVVCARSESEARMDKARSALSSQQAEAVPVAAKYPLATFEHQDVLSLGLYRIHWKSGGSSLAAIGMMENGDRWIAPTNWTSPCLDPSNEWAWGGIERAELLPSPADAGEPGIKALEWNPFRAETPFGYYDVVDQTDLSAEELKGRAPFLLTGSRLDYSRHLTLADARAAAQADYETRIRSALIPATSQAKGGAEVVAWLRVEKPIDEHMPARRDVTLDATLADMWRANEYTESLTELCVLRSSSPVGQTAKGGE